MDQTTTGGTMNIFSLSISTGVKNGISAFPDLLMALAFLATWIEPGALGTGIMKYFSFIMILEFITIHSAGFLGFAIFSGRTKFQKISRVIVLGIFYSLFIFSFSSPAGEFWPLTAFWLLLFNRILGVLLGDNSATSIYLELAARWGWSVLCFVLSMIISLTLPMPRFGWVGDVVHRMGPGGAGVWYEQPHTLLAAGFLYFLSVSIFEMVSHRITAGVVRIDPAVSLFRK